MSLAELVRGAGDTADPSRSGRWIVTSQKRDGVMPGFQIRDSRGRKYLLKFDPPAHPELATAAEVIGSKFFHALGYHVPQNYIVCFERSQLAADPAGKGKKAPSEKDIDEALSFVPRNSDGQYRGVASLILDGEPLGPFMFHGVRPDDPNDAVRHEHRRELRGLYVFSAWLQHTDVKAGNTLDMLVEENGGRYVKHHLLDFAATLGSASLEAKSPRQGHEYMIDWKPSLAQLVTAGLYVPKWARTRHVEPPGAGRFEAEAFDPRRWKPNYPNPAFENRLPEDEAWAAGKVAAFRDDEIRAVVQTGRYSDPRTTRYVAETLMRRRDKIADAFLKPGPRLRNLRVRDNRLEFDAPAAAVEVRWVGADPRTGKVSAIARGPEIPPACAAERCAAWVSASGENATVYLATVDGRAGIVGVDRNEEEP